MTHLHFLLEVRLVLLFSLEVEARPLEHFRGPGPTPEVAQPQVEAHCRPGLTRFFRGELGRDQRPVVLAWRKEGQGKVRRGISGRFDFDCKEVWRTGQISCLR